MQTTQNQSSQIRGNVKAQALRTGFGCQHRLWPDNVAAVQTVEQAMPLERLDIVHCDDARHAVRNANRNGLTRSEVAAFSHLPTGSWNVSHHIAALRESDIHPQRTTMEGDFLDPPHPDLVRAPGKFRAKVKRSERSPVAPTLLTWLRILRPC